MQIKASMVVAGIVALSACTQRAPEPAATISPAQGVSPSAPATTSAASPEPIKPAPTAISAVVTQQPAGQPVTSNRQPALFSGAFTYTNDIVARRFADYSVGMIDLYGFVKRDENFEIPIDSQTLGFMKFDTKAKTGVYRLEPPLLPRAQFVDVDNNGRADQGVQVFGLAFWGNRAGGPYAEGDDKRYGWPGYLTSYVMDPDDDELIGGKIIVWSPDDKQFVPSGFGADKQLFTADDPVMPVPAGYSVLDLDKNPFAILREPESLVQLFEPRDLAIKDYSKLGYAGAFDKAFAQIRKEYAFNGIAGKAPDWDTLEAVIKPLIADAERKKDAAAFYAAMRKFVGAFKDGHVGASASALVGRAFVDEFGGGFGLILRELDDKRVIVRDVLANSAAARAGIVPGMQLVQVDGLPVSDAIARTQPFGEAFSSAWSQRAEQVRFVARGPRGGSRTFAFQKKGEAERTFALQSAVEFDSIFNDLDSEEASRVALPIEHKLLASGSGYIRINTSNDDLELSYRLLRRAFEAFEKAGIKSVIIDLRHNSGGTGLGTARFLISEPQKPEGIRSLYFNDKTGRFEDPSKAPPLPLIPNERTFKFDKLALLVGRECVSACESEAYALSRVPGMQVFGFTPTAGVYAEVARGRYELPEGISLQVPTGRSEWPDGRLFLEGTGVAPTLRVPMDEAAALSRDDAVLKAAENALK